MIGKNHYDDLTDDEAFKKEYADRVNRIIAKYNRIKPKFKRAAPDRHLKVKRGY